MTRYLGGMLRMMSALALVLGLACGAMAQEEKPIAVISINKMDELMSDIGGLTELAGQADQGRLVLGMAGIYTNGVDRTKPAGAVVSMGPAGPKVLAFVPVKNLKALLGTYREQIGTPKDAGDGVLEIGADRPTPIYVKEQGGYAFISQDARNLSGLPQDPVKLLGGLPAKYDIAVQFNIGNIPAELRDLFVSQMKMGYDQAMRQQQQQLPPEQREVADQLGRAMVQGVQDFVEQADQITLGFAIDGKTKGTSLELAVTAREGTELSKQFAAAYELKSMFGGIGSKDAAATGNVTVALAKTDIAQILGLIKAGRDGALAELAKDTGVPEAKREGLKKAVNGVFDVVQGTVEKGKMDFAGAANLGSEFEVVAGTFVGDGKKLESIVKELVALGKGEPGFPDVQLDVGTYKGVTFHKIEIPSSELDENARKVFGGDHVEVVLGFGADKALVAVGKDGQASLKGVIDRGAGAGLSTPLQVQLAVGKIVEFVNKVDSNPQTQALASSAAKVNGRDQVTISVKPIDRGVSYRYEVSAGVLELAGEAARAAQGGR
ncbi:MAG: hypothetical protein U0939_01580 [Pirellulales bacterium]